jgi:hypothetical protein
MSWSKERFSSKRNVTFSSMSLDDGTNAPSFSMMLCSDISFLFSLGVAVSGRGRACGPGRCKRREGTDLNMDSFLRNVTTSMRSSAFFRSSMLTRKKTILLERAKRASLARQNTIRTWCGYTR